MIKVQVNGQMVEVATATKKDDKYFDESGKELAKTPRPLGLKLWAVMPPVDSDGYADYALACKRIKFERMAPGRVTRLKKAADLLNKTMKPNLYSATQEQVNEIADYLDFDSMKDDFNKAAEACVLGSKEASKVQGFTFSK